MGLQMHFRMLKRRGFNATESYRLARFAKVHHTSLYIALHDNGYDADAYTVIRPTGSDWRIERHA